VIDFSSCFALFEQNLHLCYVPSGGDAGRSGFSPDRLSIFILPSSHKISHISLAALFLVESSFQRALLAGAYNDSPMGEHSKTHNDDRSNVLTLQLSL